MIYTIEISIDIPNHNLINKNLLAHIKLISN